MYDTTKIRMLLTTALIAAVAALIAGGANARIPAEEGDWANSPNLTGVRAALAPSWQGKGGKGEDTGSALSSTLTGVHAALAPSWQGKGGKGEETG